MERAISFEFSISFFYAVDTPHVLVMAPRDRLMGVSENQLKHYMYE